MRISGGEGNFCGTIQAAPDAYRATRARPMIRFGPRTGQNGRWGSPPCRNDEAETGNLTSLPANGVRGRPDQGHCTLRRYKYGTSLKVKAVLEGKTMTRPCRAQDDEGLGGVQRRCGVTP